MHRDSSQPPAPAWERLRAWRTRATRSAPRGAVLDAYLTDIEPVEPWLRARDADLVTQLEASFTATRVAPLRSAIRGAHQATAHALGPARSGGADRTRRRPAASVFGFAALVIVREGFEAAVIIAALLAVVKKRQEATRARLVHAGWLSALALGAVAFVLGRNVLAGAMNETLEGCLALVAAAMLLHAALWLNARSTTRRTMGALRERTQGALDRGGLALFGIAFLAMFRETFETAVFLEALSIDAPSAVVWGSLCGTALLLLARLRGEPPGAPTAHDDAVQGVDGRARGHGGGARRRGRALVRGGGVARRRGPCRSSRIEFLGIYPDLIGVLAQLLVALGPLAWKAWSDHRAAAGASRLDDAHPKPGE